MTQWKSIYKERKMTMEASLNGLAVSFYIFAVLMLAVQVFVILSLMRLHDIAANIDKMAAILAAIANKKGVTQDDVERAWGLEKGARAEKPQAEPQPGEKKEVSPKAEEKKSEPKKEEVKEEKSEEKKEETKPEKKEGKGKKGKAEKKS